MSSKKEWGNACWYLFHTLAYKLKEEYNSEVSNLLNHIISICGNLPCPDCSKHATETLQRVNKGAVNNKESLINVLFQFHNMVSNFQEKSMINYILELVFIIFIIISGM